MGRSGTALWLLMLPFAAALAGCEGFPGVPACADDEACGAGARCDLETGRCVAAPSPRPEAGAGTDAAGSDAARSLPDARPEADAAMPDSAEDAAPADPDAAPAGSDAAPDAGSDATPDAGSDAAPPDAAPDACAPAPEICNGLDDDCDDAADEEAAGVGSECLTDGLGACAAGLRRCQPEQGLVCEPINVPAEEVCDGLDNDCDGETDEALAERCYPGDEATADVGLCRRGERRCEGARWTDCEGAVTPAEEICDGLDDDCDGETDEADPALCGECAVPGAAGACVRGVGVCREGAIVCARWPGLRAEGTCDLADDDCDGAVDEDGEVPVEPDADAVEACGPPGGDPLAAAPADDPVCQGDEAGLYGCGAVHACLDPICLGGCAVTEARSVEACAADCGGDDRCVWGCHGEAAAAARACRADCPPPDEGTTRWSCAPGDGCAPAVCADGWRLRDGRCVRPEICNNGLDDDGDGLVDGVVDPTFFGPDHCMVRLATEGTETTIALCPPGADDADCDNGPEEGNDDEYCAEGHCPQRARFSYDYALDHEEVSIRAYHECVRTGCCRPPVDARYRLAAGALDSGSAPPRPTEPNGCEPAPAIDPTDPPDSIADLPVTGVTWCEARDFCLWAGKRLPTETEWERGATGASPGRLRNGFGSRRPARCWEEACCAGPDFDGVVPDSCEPASRVVLCPAGTVEPDGIRPACVGTYDQFNSQCASLREDCFACIRGPAPAYGNEDGQTREGILNMGGNVTEWAFDWYREQRANPIDDAVGPGCPDLEFQLSAKATRGGAFNSDEGGVNGFARRFIPPYVRSNALGFRCGRTLPEGGGLCRSNQVSDLEEACRPRGVPLCAAPDFTSPADAEHCPGGARQDLANCATPLERYCTLDPLPCGSLVFTRLIIDTASLSAQLQALTQFVDFDAPELPEFNQRLAIIDDAIDADLTPNGGATTIALELPCAAPGAGRHRLRVVNGTLAQNADGEPVLSELGRLQDGRCTPIESAETEVEFIQRERMSNVCVSDDGAISLRGFAASVPLSGLLLFDTTAVENPLTLRGNMVLVVSDDAMERSVLGPDLGGLEGLLQLTSIEPMDLCFLQELSAAVEELPAFLEGLLGPWECSDFAQLEGCSAGRCVGVRQEDGSMDTDVCTGRLIPLSYRAVDESALPLGQVSCEDCR